MTDSNKTRDTMAMWWKNVGEKRLYGIGTCLKWIVSHEFFSMTTLYIMHVAPKAERIEFDKKKNTHKKQIDNTNNQTFVVCFSSFFFIYEFQLVCAHKSLFVFVWFLLCVCVLFCFCCCLIHLLRSIRSVSWVRVRTLYTHICVYTIWWYDGRDEMKGDGKAKYK